MKNLLGSFILFGGFTFLMYIFIKTNNKNEYNKKSIDSIDMFKLRRHTRILRRCSNHGVTLVKGSIALIDEKECDLCIKE